MIEQDAAVQIPAQTVAPELVPDRDLSFTVVNERVVIRDDLTARWRVVLVSGVVYSRYPHEDAVSERQVCVQLRFAGLAKQEEIVAGFGHVRATQCRWERQYREEGLAGLFTQPPAGRRSVMPRSVEDAIVELHGEGLGMRRISARLGVTLHQVAGVYGPRSLEPHLQTHQEELFEAPTSNSDSGICSAAGDEAEVLEAEDDGEATGRCEPWDGWLLPEYESGTNVAWAGVLLALPVLRKHRVLEVLSEVYQTLGFWAVYGLQTVVTLMVCLALWRVKRPEHLKGHSPQDLGRALGLPRAPEVKTVRRKLAQLAAREQAREAMLKLAEVHLQQQEDLLGYLYVDGHVRTYNGKHNLAKGYSMVRHMPVRSTTDTWANDRNGDPVFLVTCEINEGLTQTLEEVLAEARRLAGEDRRITVIFDRGGWSPQLFVNLIRGGFDIITYRKGTTKDLDGDSFERRTFEAEGAEAAYWLCDRERVRVGQANLSWGDESPRPLFLREVTRLNPETGHQTKVLTTHTDLEPEEVLWRMFARWRQENFFKYMMEEFAVDGLVEYGCEPVDPGLERPNPEHRAITEEITGLKAQILRLQGQRCELIGDADARVDAPPGFERFVPDREIARKLHQEIRDAKHLLEELETRRSEIPERISAAGLKRLLTERQLIATVFKIAAYRIESELVRMVAPHYARCEDEGRKLIAAALRSPADLEVTDRELKVTLAPQSSPHRSRAIAALCDSLNNLGTVVPGTTLRLVLDCATQEPSDVSS